MYLVSWQQMQRHRIYQCRLKMMLGMSALYGEQRPLALNVALNKTIVLRHPCGSDNSIWIEIF